MKETINANIGSLAFTLDRDAYEELKAYFADIRRRLPEGDTETLDDIERRMAEIFREKVNTPMRVVTLDIVQAAIAQRVLPTTSELRAAEARRPNAKSSPAKCSAASCAARARTAR